MNKPESKSKYVLIVDNELELRSSIAEFLRDEGFSVREASHGQEALDMLRSQVQKPCLILLDYMMPILDGAGFRKIQLEDPSISSIPVVLMSAGRFSDDIVELLSLQAIVNKPIDLDVLIAIVGKHCL
jgi:CheY-like chemotaxis protein